MTEKPKETENSSSSTKEIKSNQISLDIFKQTQNITKKKILLLIKKWKKIYIKKKRKRNGKYYQRNKRRKNTKNYKYRDGNSKKIPLKI